MINKSSQNYILSLLLFFTAIVVLSTSTKAQGESDFELVSIEFEGDILFSKAELSKTILSQESPSWFSQFLYSFTSFGGQAVFYNPGFVNSDINRLQAYYRDRGYFETKITSEVQVDTSNNDTELIYHIIPGEPSTIKDYKLTGLDKIFPDFIEMVEDRVTFERGDYYSAQEVNNTRAVIVNFLGDRGYMTVTTNPPEILIDTLRNEVEITLDFNPGSRFKISELRIKIDGEGKEEVDNDLLLELIDVNEGEFYSNEKNQLSQVRLYRTDLFNSALILGVRKDTLNNQVPLEILTNVKKIHQITPELIFNGENEDLNLGLALEFSKRNFLGGARKLSSTFSVASTNPIKFISHLNEKDSLYGYADGRLRLEQPMLFGKYINTVYEAYYTNRKRVKDYSSILYGGRVNLNFDLPRFTFVTSLSSYFNLEFEENEYQEDFIRNSFIKHLRISDKDAHIDTITSRVDNYLDSSKFNLISSSDNILLGINIGMNNTNDQQLMFPTQGTNFQVIFEGGNVLNPLLNKVFNIKENTPEYYKIQISSSAYFPLFNLERSAFAFKLKGGIIHAYKGNKYEIPLNHRFYSGGSNSVRGWEARDLNSKQSQLTSLSDIDNLSFTDFEQIYNQGIIPGGFFMLEASAEARIHLIEDIGSALFIDAGNNWDDPGQFDFDELGIAVGFGLRYYSPFAPIRIDFAFKLWDPKDKKSFSDLGFRNAFQFQIGIGEAF